jgi:hypothetical protein
MKMNKYLIINFLLGWLLIQTAYTQEYRYFIVTNINTSTYQKPGTVSPKNEFRFAKDNSYRGFFSNELIRSDTITNINGAEWALIFKDKPEWRGWMKTAGTYQFEGEENGQLYKVIVLKELVEGHVESGFNDYRYVELSFTNFNNGYLMFHYAWPGGWAGGVNGSFYRLGNGDWNRVFQDSGIYKQYIFHQRFIILLDCDLETVVYDTERTEFDSRQKNKQSYATVMQLTPYKYGYFRPSSGQHFDSHLEYDTNTGLLTAYLRTNINVPFDLHYYQFNETNGEFILLTNYIPPKLDMTNASGQTDSVSPNAMYVLTGDSVRMRSEAGTNGAVAAVLSKGARVKLLERKGEEVEIGGRRGHWAYVEVASPAAMAGKRGWVFDAYMGAE